MPADRPLGPLVPPTGCSYSADLSTNVCDAEAAYHFRFGADGGFACEAHWGEAIAYGMDDWHRVDHRCTLAQLVGGTWVWSTTETGHCEPAEPDIVGAAVVVEVATS